MKTVLPLRSQCLTFRRLTEADIGPMHSHQSREDYAVHAWRGPRNMDDVIGVAQGHTGRGFAAEAANAAVDAAFQRLGAHRVFARLDSLNVASAKVCERIGMRHEATLRESHFQLGEWRDELIYAVLVSGRAVG